MAKLTGQLLINRLCDRMAWSQGLSADRTNALNALIEAAHAIQQLGSLNYLEFRTTISLPNGQDFIDLESLTWAGTIDIGKQVTIGLPGGRKGALQFLGKKEFFTTPQWEYGAWNTNQPSYWTFAVTAVAAGASGLRRIQFDRVNTTGGPLVFPITAQQLPATIDDTANTTMSLPEGYEITLALPYAEMEEKRKLNHSGWKELHAALFGDDEERIGGRLGRFLAQFGSAEEHPEPEDEQIRSAQARSASEGT